MRNRLASLVVLLAVSGVQIGCGESAIESGALDQAIMSFDLAQRGYVPAGGGDAGSGQADARVHRQKALNEAGQELDAIIASGSDSEQLAARRLRANVDLSAARYAAREAAMAYARLTPQAVNLVSHLMLADRASARGLAMDTNQPEVVRQLQAEVTTQTQRQQELQQQSAELTRQLEAEQTELNKVKETRGHAMAAAQALRDQAFVADGDRQYDLYNQAGTQEREAAVATAEIERRQLSIDMLNSQLGVINSQLSLSNDLLTELNGRIEAARQRQQEIEQGMATAQQDHQEALAQLTTQFQQVMGTYREQVDARLAEASQRMASAVQHLKAAQSLSGSDNTLRQSVRADLLAALTAQAQVLTERAQVVNGFHQIVAVLNDGAAKLNPQQPNPFQAPLNELTTTRDQVAAQAREVIEEAQTLAGELSGGAGDIAEAAEVQSQRLQQYLSYVGQ